MSVFGFRNSQLQGEVSLLATLAGTQLLDNWRADLAPEFQEECMLPWWLDGTLTRRMEKIQRRCERDDALICQAVREHGADSPEHRAALRKACRPLPD